MQTAENKIKASHETFVFLDLAYPKYVNLVCQDVAAQKVVKIQLYTSM